MIYDCCIFFNELDLLEIRLRALEDVVDRFVVCEAPFTFRGAPKPLWLRGAIDRFARWRDRLTILTYPGPPDPDPWRNEWGQRAFLGRGLDGCDPDDLVLVSDCDEIPDPRNVALRPQPGRVLGHRQREYTGFLNRLAVGPTPLYATRSVRAGDIARYGDLNVVRRLPVDRIDRVDGGWHFTSLGGATVLEEKIRAYSHSELDVPYYRDLSRLEITIAGADDEISWVPLDDTFPAFLRDPRWERYVWPEPPSRRTNADVAPLVHAHGCFAYVPPAAATVAAVTAEVAAWEHAGRARYGSAFAGAYAQLGEVLRVAAPDGCVVLDGVERLRSDDLAALARTGAAVVAFANNARSFSAFEAVAGGGPFAPGRALGRDELERWLLGFGWRIAACSRIVTRGILALFAQMPDTLYGAEVGRFRFPRLERAALEAFVARAYVFTLESA